MKLSPEIESEFIKLAEDRGVSLEGNILKLIEPQAENFKDYIESAINKDTENRKKRLEITRQIQEQNKELAEKALENDGLMVDLKDALELAEKAKEEALSDLDLIQKKSQFELIGRIVQVALWIIMGVGVTTTVLYSIALFSPSIDTTLLGNAWSNLFSILLTNSFSIIGTIMGVKYASEGNSKKSE